MTSKRKFKPDVSSGGRVFHDQWTGKFEVTKHEDKALCCIFKKLIIARFYNINSHFESNHNALCSMKVDEKFEEIQREVKQYKQQTSSFKKIFKPKNNVSAASFQVSHTIALHGKPLSDGAYIKEAFKACSEMLFEAFPNKTDILKKIDELPVARNTVKGRIIAIN